MTHSEVDLNLDEAFCDALREGNIAEVQRCLAAGVPLNYNIAYKGPPLFIVLDENNYALAKLLLDYGVDPLIREEETENNALHFLFGSFDYLYDWYLRGDTLPNIERDIRENRQIAKLLIDAGTLLTEKNVYGLTPMQYITYNYPLREFVETYAREKGIALCD